jgi:hypothetical protein
MTALYFLYACMDKNKRAILKVSPGFGVSELA